MLIFKRGVTGMRRLKIRTRTVCIALALVLSYLAVSFFVENIDTYIPTMAEIQGNDFYVVLDAGHGGYVLSIVIYLVIFYFKNSN